jgi:tetratricopeptide (TPR) repeat protein
MIPAQNLAPTERSRRTIAAAVLLLAALVASAVLAPQLAFWPSAPALLLLAVAMLFLLPARGSALPRPVMVSGLLLAAWLGGRAATSPVAEFAFADLSLMAACLAGFFLTRRLLATSGAIELLFGGLGLFVLINWIPMLLQARDPAFAPVLPRGTESFPSGFFSYYGDCASFLLGVALLSGGLAWDAGRSKLFRVFLTAVAVAAAAGVVFTKSRGGIAGLGAGALVLLFVAPWLTARKGSSRFAAFVLAVPVLLVGGFVLLGGGMDEAQKARGYDAGSAALLDNSARLMWAGIAVSCIATHPVEGGGSRSFSWESLQFWDARAAGFSPAKPEFVHNELIQITTDYGVIGLLLLVVFLGSAVVCAIVGRWSGPSAKARTAVFVGGLAALTGLLVHGSLHFVFHLPPTALLLGVTLAFLLDTARRDPSPPGRLTFLTAALPILAVFTLLAGIGGHALPVFLELAPVKYQLPGGYPGPAETITRLEAAARHWPAAQFHLQRGLLLQAAAREAPGGEGAVLLEAAAGAFEQALELNPYHPEASVNRANVLSALGRDTDAEREYERAIRLQGGMEIGFNARYSASIHHYRKAERQRVASRLDEALVTLLRARDLYDAALNAPDSNEFGEAGRAYRMSLSQQLGTWLQASGRFEDAAAEYDRATRIPYTWPLHFLAATNLTAWGDHLWLERKPELALRRFTEARARLARAEGRLPQGFTATDLQELTRKLESKVAFLEGAGIRLEEDGGSGGR